MHAQRYEHTKSLIMGYTVSKETQDIEAQLGLTLLYYQVFSYSHE